MKISINGISLIMSFQPPHMNAYLNSDKLWTIGYNDSMNVHEGDVLTEYEAVTSLEKDLTMVEMIINTIYLRMDLTQNEYDALVSYAYSDNTILQALNSITKIEVEHLFEQSIINSKQSSIVRRRTAEYELFKTL